MHVPLLLQLFDPGRDRSDDLCVFRRLEDIIVHMQANAVLSIAEIVVRRQDDADKRLLCDLPDLPERFHPAFQRHVDVHEDEVRLILIKQVYSLLTIFRGNDLIDRRKMC